MNRWRKQLAVLSLGSLVGIAAFLGFQALNHPVGLWSSPRLLDIPPGTSFRQVVTLLHEQHLIRSSWFVTLLGRLQRLDRKIFPGEYELHEGLKSTEILAKLDRGELYQHAVTIPEGFSMIQIADILDQKGLARKSDVLQLGYDQEFIRSLDLTVSSLEGYLFPDTYHFSRYTPPEMILKTMVAHFQKVVTPEMREQAAQNGMTLHELLTLASVVEKETGLSDERPLVAGVFHNRLKNNIPLQSDPTVIYALENFDGDLRKADLSIRSPYNTYRVRGLPPGPIANPGLDAIRAVLEPTKTNYVYFVSRNDGSHEFSTTLAEHNRAVDKYQRRGRSGDAS